jgi:serine/threonine protein kinase
MVRMTDHFYFRGHLCIVTELLSINLYELIKANNFSGFSTTLVRRFTVQMLSSLQLMRSHRIVHCDLKPEVRNQCWNSLMNRISCYVILFGAVSKLSISDRRVWRPRRVRLPLFRGSQLTPSLHIHSISILPKSGSHPRHELRYGNRYVVSGLYPS